MKIDIKTSHVSHEADERYASYTMDLWQPGLDKSWKGASALSLNLEDNKLKTLAKRIIKMPLIFV